MSAREMRLEAHTESLEQHATVNRRDKSNGRVEDILYRQGRACVARGDRLGEERGEVSSCEGAASTREIEHGT